MFVNSDFSDLLKIFNANGVENLVIGGYALIQYAEPRYTKDLDLWIFDSRQACFRPSSRLDRCRFVIPAAWFLNSIMTTLLSRNASQWDENPYHCEEEVCRFRWQPKQSYNLMVFGW